MKVRNRDMERRVIQPEGLSLPERRWLEAGRAIEFMDEEMSCVMRCIHFARNLSAILWE